MDWREELEGGDQAIEEERGARIVEEKRSCPGEGEEGRAQTGDYLEEE